MNLLRHIPAPNRPVAFILILLLCLTVNLTNAQELNPDSVYAIGEVEVHGLRHITHVQNIPHHVIKQLPSNSVADALKYMAGVQIKDYGGLGGQKTVNVRSLGAQHVGVYIDGVRVTNVQNGTVDLGKYSLSTLESIQLFNGNKNQNLMMASEYASAATVYLQTHRPDSTSLQASASIGSFGTYKAQATASYKRHGFIDAGFTYSKGNYPYSYHTQYEDTTGRRTNSDIRKFRIEGCYFTDKLQLHAYFFDSERGLPGGIVRRLSNTFTDVGREWDRNFFTQISFKHHYSNWQLRAIGKYCYDRLHYRSDYPQNISGPSTNNTYHQQDGYMALAASHQTLPWLLLSASTDFRLSNLTCDVRYFNYVYRTDSKTSLSAFVNQGSFSASANLLYTYVADHTKNASSPLHKFCYNTVASYSLRNITFRTFYKSVFRVPTLNDLYYTLAGNRNLKPEYARQLNIGLSFNNPYVNLQADAYFNRIENRIVCLPLKGSYMWTMLNYGRTRCLGIDISATGTLKNNTLMLSATLQDDRNKTSKKSPDYNDFIAYSPRFSASAIYTLQIKHIAFTASHMYVGERYWTAENNIEEPLKAYNCTDAKIGYTISRFIAEAECQNIFNQPFEIIQRWPMPGRRFAITLKYSI